MKSKAILAALLVAGSGLGASGAAAQTAPAPAQANRGPTAMLLQTMCAAWFAGLDAKKMAEAASAHGFKPLWIGERLGGMQTPDALAQQGWAGVQFGEGRTSCGITIGWVGSSPLDSITADIENWLKARAPGGPYARQASGWKEGAAGKAERRRAWDSAGYELTVTETPDAMMSEMNDGKMAVSVAVYMRRK